jgi:hypothetical protein
VAEVAVNGRRTVRVLVADDNELFAETIAWMLDEYEEIEVVGRAVNGRAAVRLAAALEPDVVLMDMDMPVLDGIEATGALGRHRRPRRDPHRLGAGRRRGAGGRRGRGRIPDEGPSDRRGCDGGPRGRRVTRA